MFGLLQKKIQSGSVLLGGEYTIEPVIVRNCQLIVYPSTNTIRLINENTLYVNGMCDWQIIEHGGI